MGAETTNETSDTYAIDREQLGLSPADRDEADRSSDDSPEKKATDDREATHP